MAPNAWASRLGSRPSSIRTGSSAGVLSVVGMPRRSVTDRAAGSSARRTFGGKGISTNTVACSSMRSTPLPSPSSLPSWRKSGSEESTANLFWASLGDIVPVSRPWQVRQVRPLPPKVSRSNKCLRPWRSPATFASSSSAASPCGWACASDDVLTNATATIVIERTDANILTKRFFIRTLFSRCIAAQRRPLRPLEPDPFATKIRAQHGLLPKHLFVILTNLLDLLAALPPRFRGVEENHEEGSLLDGDAVSAAELPQALQ